MIKKILQKCRILFAKFTIVIIRPIKAFCSNLPAPISRVGKGVNNILTIFRSPTAIVRAFIVVFIASGNLLLYFFNIEKKDIEGIEQILITCLSIFIPLVIAQILGEISKLKKEYTEAITKYSTTVKSFVDCAYLIIVLFCVVIFVTLGRKYFDTNLLRPLPSLVTHIISLSLIINLGLVVKLIDATSDYFSEMIEGLSKETDKEQLRKHFSYLCSKDNAQWTQELTLIAFTRKEDLFLITKDSGSITGSEEYQITNTFLDTPKSHFEKDVKTYPALAYEQVAKYSKSFYSFALFILINFVQHLKRTRIAIYYIMGIKFLKYFLDNKLPKDSKIYQYIITSSYSFINDLNLSSSELESVLLESLDCIMACDLQTERNDSLSIFYYIKNPNHFVMILEKYASAIEKRFKEYEQKDQKYTIFALLSKVETLQLSNYELSQFFYQIDKLLSCVSVVDSDVCIYSKYWDVRLALYKEEESPHAVLEKHLKRIWEAISVQPKKEYNAKSSLTEILKISPGRRIRESALEIVKKFSSAYGQDTDLLIKCLSQLSQDKDDIVSMLPTIVLLLKDLPQVCESDCFRLLDPVLEFVRLVFCSNKNISMLQSCDIFYIVQRTLELFYDAYLRESPATYKTSDEVLKAVVKKSAREVYRDIIKAFLDKMKSVNLKKYFLFALKNATDKSDNKLLIADISSLIKSCDVL